MAPPLVPWSPDGFDRYRDLYPQTPRLVPEPDGAGTSQFAAWWTAGEAAALRALRSRAANTTVVFVRGYLGRYMPGNLRAACAAARRLGFDAFVAHNSAGGTVAGNVRALAQHIRRRSLRSRVIFCGHSRGGVECLALAAHDPDIAARCDGIALSQTPHGPSRVIESVLLRRWPLSRRRRAAETLQRAGLLLLGARSGGYELTPEVWPSIVAGVDHVDWPFPVVQTASWSSRPTAWLDSFHQRLGEIGPGRAHDGQFFLNDLIWPRLPHVLLPNVDHAQPAVGGDGFDHARYWTALLVTLLDGQTCRPIAEGTDS